MKHKKNKRQRLQSAFVAEALEEISPNILRKMAAIVKESQSSVTSIDKDCERRTMLKIHKNSFHDQVGTATAVKRT